jgi:hypothetical protein
LALANKEAIQAKGIKMRGSREHIASEDGKEIAYCESAAHWNPRRKLRNPASELAKKRGQDPGKSQRIK